MIKSTKTMDIFLNLGLLLLTITLINHFWIMENHWSRWFGVIGFIMLGFFWDDKIAPGWFK